MPVGAETIGLVVSRGTLDDPALIMKLAVDLALDGVSWLRHSETTFVGGPKTDPRTGLDFASSSVALSVPEPLNPLRRIRATLTTNKAARFTIDLVSV